MFLRNIVTYLQVQTELHPIIIDIINICTHRENHIFHSCLCVYSVCVRENWMPMRPQFSLRMLDHSAFYSTFTSKHPKSPRSLDGSSVLHVVELFSPLPLWSTHVWRAESSNVSVVNNVKVIS
jgi:hypothetical protein